jgi:hypothetical protein
MRINPGNTAFLALPRCRALPIVGLIAVTLIANSAVAQSLGALEQPPSQMQVAPKQPKPMTPARLAWLKGRCAQLVAFFDYYGVSRGENSDGARNHTRIGASIECERANYRTGIDTMAAVLKGKAFELPKPNTPALEPEDLEAPDITNPTQP